MPYSRRSRTRRKRIAVNRAKREYADVMAKRYYLTLVKRDCRCSACGRKVCATGTRWSTAEVAATVRCRVARR